MSQITKQKVFLAILYDEDLSCHIIGVYSSRQAAKKANARRENRMRIIEDTQDRSATFHVIEKSIQGTEVLTSQLDGNKNVVYIFN